MWGLGRLLSGACQLAHACNAPPPPPPPPKKNTECPDLLHPQRVASKLNHRNLGAVSACQQLLTALLDGGQQPHSRSLIARPYCWLHLPACPGRCPGMACPQCAHTVLPAPAELVQGSSGASLHNACRAGGPTGLMAELWNQA